MLKLSCVSWFMLVRESLPGECCDTISPQCSRCVSRWQEECLNFKPVVFPTRKLCWLVVLILVSFWFLFCFPITCLICFRRSITMNHPKFYRILNFTAGEFHSNSNSSGLPKKSKYAHQITSTGPPTQTTRCRNQLCAPWTGATEEDRGWVPPHSSL